MDEAFFCMGKIVLLTLWVTLFSEQVFAESIQPIVVIDINKNFAKGVLPNDDNWFGLYCKDDKNCEITHANVRIASSMAESVEGNESVDVIKTKGQPIALFHGVKLVQGKVVTWYRSEKNKIYDSMQYTSLDKLGRWQMPWGVQPIQISWVKLLDGKYRYDVSSGSKKQFLFSVYPTSHYDTETTPVIHWVGDLNGDNKLDFLLDIPDDNCGFDERLYMSLQEEYKDLFLKAAYFDGFEAACGC